MVSVVSDREVSVVPVVSDREVLQSTCGPDREVLQSTCGARQRGPGGVRQRGPVGGFYPDWWYESKLAFPTVSRSKRS